MFPHDFALTTPDKAAIIMGSTGEVITYRQLDEAAIRLSNVLRDAGLNPGDHVALCLENHARYLEILWGCHYAGLIYTACSSRLTSAELTYILNDCAAKAFITSHYKADQALDIIDTIPDVHLRLMLDGTIDGYDSFEQTIAAASVTPLTDMVDGTDMLYSSGTTGMPKGIAKPLPMSPIGTSVGLGMLTVMLFGFNENTMYLSPAPLYHAAPLRFNMTVHTLGATTIVMENFDAEEFLQLTQKYKVTQTQVVPTMFIRMLKLDSDVRSQYDCSTITHAVHAAAPCPIETKRKMIEWWGPVIHEYYAGTEGNGFVYCNSEQWLAHPGTVGTAIQGIVHICDDEGNEVANGESGTIFLRTAEYLSTTTTRRKPKHREILLVEAGQP